MGRFAALILVAGVSSHAETLAEVLGRMDQTARNFRTFSASIKHTEFTKVLNDSEQSDGVRRLKRTNNQTVGMVEFRGRNPRSIRFAGRSVEIYYPDAKRVEVWDATKLGKFGKQVDQFLLLGIGTSSSELRKDYDVKLGGTETIGSAHTTRIELTPKDNDVRKQVEKIELWIPEGESVPLQVRVTRTSQDYDQVTYADIQMNPALPDSAFELKVPADVKRVVVK